MILRELAAKYNLKFDDRSFKKADNTINKTMGLLKSFGAALGVGVVARGVWKFIDGVRQLGDEIDKTSIAIGVSRKSLQEWEFVAGLAGVEGTGLALSIRRLQKAAVDSAAGLKTYQREFDRLGITVTDTEGKLKSADDLLLEMADSMGKLETDTERVAVAQALLGRQGPKMLALFKDGSEGIKKFKKEAHDLGGILGDDMVDAAVDLTDDMWRFDFALRGIKSRIAMAVIPAFNRFILGTSKLLKKFRDITKDTKIVESALQALGIVALAVGVKLLVAFAKPLLIIGAIVILFAAFILILDEINTLFAGGKTVIGKYLDELFGIGTAQEFVDSHREGVKILGETWESVKETFSTFVDDLISGYDSINISIEGSIKWLENYAQSLRDMGGPMTVVADGITLIADAIKLLTQNWWELAKTGIKGIPILGQGIKFMEELGKRGFLPEPGAGEELKRRRLTAERGVGTGVLRGPTRGRADRETLEEFRKRRELEAKERRKEIRKAPRQPPPRIQLPPQPPGIVTAPGMVKAPAAGGINVNQNTNLNLTVQAPPGAGTQEVAQRVRGEVQAVLREDRRATINAIKQRAES